MEGITDEVRRKYRTAIIDTDRDTLVRVAREHVLKRIENHEFSKVIFGSNLANTEELEAHGYTVEEPVPGLKPAEA